MARLLLSSRYELLPSKESTGRSHMAHLGQSGLSRAAQMNDFIVVSRPDDSFVWWDLKTERNPCQVLAVVKLES